MNWRTGRRGKTKVTQEKKKSVSWAKTKTQIKTVPSPPLLRSDKLSDKQQVQPVTSQQSQEDAELWRCLQIRELRPHRDSSYSKPSQSSKMCRSFPWHRTNMTKQPPNWMRELTQRALFQGNILQGQGNTHLPSQVQQICSVRYRAWPQHFPFLSCLSHRTRRLLSFYCHIQQAPTEAGQDTSGCCSCSYTDSIPRTLFTRHRQCQGHRSRKERVARGGGQDWAFWGMERFLLLSHSTSHSCELQGSPRRLDSPKGN